MTPTVPVSAAKLTLRGQVLAARRRLDPGTLRTSAERLADNVGTLLAERDARCVSAYVSIGDEPGTRPLLERLNGAGVGVLLPLLLPDRDLDWASYRPGELRPGPFGLMQPTSPRLGVTAVEVADVIVCPGVAGSLSGDRLGRGGGSYDRTLSRLRQTTLTCLLLYDDEVLDALPTDAHDQRVDVIVTPTRILRTSAWRL